MVFFSQSVASGADLFSLVLKLLLCSDYLLPAAFWAGWCAVEVAAAAPQKAGALA